MRLSVNMSNKQQPNMQQSSRKLFPSTLVLPKLDQKYAKEGVSTLRKFDLEAFLRFEEAIIDRS